MANFVTPIAAEINAPTATGTASNVSESNIVRAVNTSSSAGYLLTIQDSDNTLIGSMTLAPSESAIVQKNPKDEIFAANANVKLSPVGYPRG